MKKKGSVNSMSPENKNFLVKIRHLIRNMRQSLRNFFEPVFSGWNQLPDQDRYVMLTGMSLCVFYIGVIKFNLFSESPEIVIGISLGMLFGSVFFFNRAPFSLGSKQKTK